MGGLPTLVGLLAPWPIGWAGVSAFPFAGSCQVAVFRSPMSYVEEVGTPGLVPPLADGLLDPSRWKLVVAGAWKYSGLIHNKGARVAVMSLRHCTRSVSYHGTWVLTLGDNLSELCASEKGRASDRALRVLLRHALAYVHAGTRSPLGASVRRVCSATLGPRFARDLPSRAAGFSHTGHPPESDSRVRRSDIAA